MITVFIVESVERFYFFRRIALSLKSELSFFFVTSEPLVYIKARMQGFSARLITSDVNIMGDFSFADQSIEILNNEFSVEDAQRAMQGQLNVLNKLKSQFEIAKIIFWNGQNILGMAAVDFSRVNNIPTQFLELSNLPSKCFSDALGVNARSEVSINPLILDKYEEIDDETHNSWVSVYKESKKGALPQAQLSNKGAKLLNYALKFCYNSVNHHSIKRYGKVAPLTPDEDYSTDSTVDLTNFIFFPMQVSSDTQIKLNSTVNNLDAIKNAYDLAKSLSACLVIKVHPAEASQLEVDKMLKMKTHLDFYVSNENTVSLIERSLRVVTINSTVGLEAMILEKPVTVLGQALYKDFDPARLKKYIHNYLVSGVDYFSNKNIEKQAALKLLGFKSEI